MATGVTTSSIQTPDNRVHLFRLQILIIDGGLLVLRAVVQQNLNAKSITLDACLKNEKQTITNLRNRGIITQHQYNTLFPPGGVVPTTSNLDITLIICILRSLKIFGLKKFNWNISPSPNDTSSVADILRLKDYRNNICHIPSTTDIEETEFKAWWNDIEQILLRLNQLNTQQTLNIQQTIDEFKTCPLDEEKEKMITEQVKKWEDCESKVDRLQAELKNVQENVSGLNKEVGGLSKEVDGLKTDVEDLKRRQDDADKTRETSTSILTEEEKYQERKNQLKKQLVNFYKSKRSTVPLSPLVEEKKTPLAGFYVIPNMVMVKQTSHTSHQEERTLVNSLTDLFITGSEDQQEIYLSADAGVGKTSFSKYLTITWSQACCPDNHQNCFKPEELNALANFEFVFLVLLRDSTVVCNIDEMIEQQLIQKIPPSSSQCPLQEVLEREKCLIILDGLDEWTHPDNGCSDKKEKVPHRYSRDNCVILTTTRPWKLGVSNLKTSDINKKVELVQLSEDSTRQLEKNAIRKMSGVNDDGELRRKTQKFDEVIEDRGLEHMTTIPLLLMYITCLWCNKIPIGNSKVEVYINIIEFLLSRTAQTQPEVHPSSDPHSDIPEYFKKHKYCEKFYSLLTALAKLAYHTLFNEERENTLVFDGSVAENYLKADDMQLSLLSGILTGSTTTKLIERKSKVSFSHKTVQELFAAIFISSQSDAQKTVAEKCKNVQSILDMSTICEFVSKMNSKMMCEISLV